MAKLPQEILDTIFSEGYKKGRAEAEEDAENRMSRILDDEKRLSYNQALEDLKFNFEEEKKVYAYNGYSLDTDKWLNSYLKSKLDL